MITIKNIDGSLKDSYKSGKMTLKEVAEEYNKAGNTNFINIDYAKKKMGIAGLEKQKEKQCVKK